MMSSEKFTKVPTIGDDDGNSSSSSSSSSCVEENLKWIELVRKQEQKVKLAALNKRPTPSAGHGQTSVKTDRQDDGATASAASVGHKMSQRKITLDFIDSSNERKFKDLEERKKLKGTQKRPHEGADEGTSDGSDSAGGGTTTTITTTNSVDKLPKRMLNTNYEKRPRCVSASSSSTSSTQPRILETDPAILARRQKQIDYGKNTIAYDRYLELVPKLKRLPDHPRTPNKNRKYSRRAFDGLIKIWRKQLHHYDPMTVADAPAAASSDSSSSDSE